MPAIRGPHSLRAKIAVLAAAGGVVGGAAAIATPASAQPARPDAVAGVVTVSYYQNEGNGLLPDGTQVIPLVSGKNVCTQLTPPAGADYYQISNQVAPLVRVSEYSTANCSGTVKNYAAAGLLSYQDMLPSNASVLIQGIS